MRDARFWLSIGASFAISATLALALGSDVSWLRNVGAFGLGYLACRGMFAILYPESRRSA